MKNKKSFTITVKLFYLYKINKKLLTLAANNCYNQDAVNIKNTK